MSQSLIGSRYDTHIARKGTPRARTRTITMPYTRAISKSCRRAMTSSGYVHSYEVGSTVDGPGIRFVGFLTGCLLRCQYCHNPDTWHKHNGQPVTVARAMQVIGKYAQVLKLSKGGVTLSGGEPMVQHAFVTQVFRRCKQLGLHTCMDTSGRLGDVQRRGSDGYRSAICSTSNPAIRRSTRK